MVRGKVCPLKTGYAVDTHEQSPWHLIDQAKLDLNAHFTIISTCATCASPNRLSVHPYVPKTHSGIIIHPQGRARRTLSYGLLESYVMNVEYFA